jgi:hypothetical protein
MEALSRSEHIFDIDQAGSFTPGMELVANVIIHKARHCVFDVEAFGKLTRTVNTCNKPFNQAPSFARSTAPIN